MKVVVALKILYLQELSDMPPWTDHDIEFFVEESNCIDNAIEQIHQEIENNPGFCTTCRRAEGKYLRRATPEDINDLVLMRTTE